MQHYTIARPYAKAAFAEAKSSGKLQEWAVFLHNAGMAVQDASVKNLLESPSLSPLRWTEFFADIAGADVEMKNFLMILAKNKRLELLADISDLYQEMLAKSQGVVTVEVVSSAPLDEAQKTKLYESAQKRFSAKIEMEYALDESLIGGAIIRSGNWVMDGSIKGKLARMRENLG